MKRTMNRTTTRFQPAVALASLALAAVVTLAMLATVDTLARSDAPSALLAQLQSTRA